MWAHQTSIVLPLGDQDKEVFLSNRSNEVSLRTYCVPVVSLGAAVVGIEEEVEPES